MSQRKPTALRIVEGNPGKRKLNRKEPKPRVSHRRPSPPDWLGRTGKALWRKLTKELMPLGLLTVVDEHVLAMLCQAWSRYREADSEWTKSGPTFETANGYVAHHPHVSICRDMAKQVRALSGEFGLSPSSRSGIKGGTGESERDEFEEFLSGKR
jgi:P27 family predicted phage terminase small subunit